MAGVSLKGVCKTYRNGFTAVQDISADIEDGEFVVIVGPSGCGKSTLLRMIAGLETVTAGDLFIDGVRVNDREPSERDIAMVFQNYALYPHMSVYENMAYGLKNRKFSADEIARKVARAAEILNIEPYLKSRPGQLSGGQRQRVAMGRAIVRSPKVFLFDEPLSNLDAKLRVQMRIEIKRLQRELGTTTIYVTHDQVEAMTLADRLIAMNVGRVEQIGPPLALYRQPQTRFVASFIGSPAINFVPAVTAENGVTLADGSTIAVPVKPGVAAGTAVSLAVRPEHMLLADPATAPLRGKMEFTEILGAETLLYVTLDLPGAATTAIVRQLGDDPIPTTAIVGLDFIAGELSVFATSGERL